MKQRCPGLTDKNYYRVPYIKAFPGLTVEATRLLLWFCQNVLILVKKDQRLQ
jgi:hypothetical protein